MINPGTHPIFNIYINDLPSASEFFKFIMYADDTTLHYCIDSINSTDRDRIINHELDNVNNWLVSNKLLLNVKKTKYMVFHKHINTVSDLNIKINNSPISRVETFNSSLIWNTHVQEI